VKFYLAGVVAVALATVAYGHREALGSAPSEWIDASVTLDPATTPVYEGDPGMRFEFTHDMRKGDFVTGSSYTLGAHSGTHIDGPMHFIRDGAPIDRVSIDRLIGPARVIDIPDNVQAIDAAELGRHSWKGARRILFRTRSSLHGWLTQPKFHRDFTYIAPDAAQLLADAGVQLVGIDSPDPAREGYSHRRGALVGRGQRRRLRLDRSPDQSRWARSSAGACRPPQASRCRFVTR
jgi:kynurenine formamidase